ncbi:MAG: adenylate cyclase [Pseudonocardiales bacterium]|nr:adenylate cyclase [Pseudonocardiales bacterium]
MTDDEASRTEDGPHAEDPGEQVRLGPLIEPLEALRRGEWTNPGGQAPVREAIDTIVLGAPRRYTWQRFVELTGLDDDQARAHWRAIGLPQIGDDDAPFTDHDVENARLMSTFTELGILPAGVAEAVARAMAQSMSRLAEWQVDMLLRLLVGERFADLSPREALRLTTAALPLLEQAQAYVWRRHLEASVSRLPLRLESDDVTAAGTVLAVGFADMVGFTHATRELTATQLAALLERFESSTAGVVADGRGRIVKTVGDEVLFVADDVTDMAAIAIALQERVRSEPDLPGLHIGLALGDVLVRYGDVFGEPVNIAARLTSRSAPNEILVDARAAWALATDTRFALTAVDPVDVQGYQHLECWRLGARPRAHH